MAEKKKIQEALLAFLDEGVMDRKVFTDRRFKLSENERIIIDNVFFVNERFSTKIGSPFYGACCAS